MPVFNYEFSVGTMVIAGTFVATMGGFYFGTKNDLRNLREDFSMAMTKIEESLVKLNSVILEIALSKQRQDNYERRTDETFTQLKEEMKELKNRIKDA